MKKNLFVPSEYDFNSYYYSSRIVSYGKDQIDFNYKETHVTKCKNKDFFNKMYTMEYLLI